MKSKFLYAAVVLILIGVVLTLWQQVVYRKLADEPPAGPCKETETIRLKSPYGDEVYAVLVEKRCPFESSVIMAVYLTEEKHGVAAETAVSILYETEDLDLTWSAPRVLNVEYKTAKILSSKNSWKKREVGKLTYNVQLNQRKN